MKLSDRHGDVTTTGDPQVAVAVAVSIASVRGGNRRQAASNERQPAVEKWEKLCCALENLGRALEHTERGAVFGEPPYVGKPKAEGTALGLCRKVDVEKVAVLKIVSNGESGAAAAAIAMVAAATLARKWRQPNWHPKSVYIPSKRKALPFQCNVTLRESWVVSERLAKSSLCLFM